MAKIDIEVMTRMVKSMQDIGEALEGIRHEYGRSLRRFGASDREARDLEGPQRWVQERLPDLRRRLALAQQIEAGRPSWATGPVTIKERELSSMGAAQARAAGAETALALLKDTRSPDGELVRLLQEMCTDPYFASGFASAVTPEELAQLVSGWSGARAEAGADDPDRDARYESLVASLSTTIATATYGTGDLAPPPGYAQAWLAAITAAPVTDPAWDGGQVAQADQAAALSVLLGAGGRFEPGFISTVASGVLTYEEQYLARHGRSPWPGRTYAGIVGDGGAGVHDPVYGGDGGDPLVGILTALSRHPEQSAEFLDPDSGGPVASARMEYLVALRDWSQDSYASVSLALQAAGTAWHSTHATPAQQERSAWITSAAVHHLAGRDGGKIGPEAAAALGDLLAAYVADMDRALKFDGVALADLGATGTQFPATTAGKQAPEPWLASLPVGAEFDIDQLNRVLRQIMLHDQAAVSLAEGASVFNTARIAAAAAAFEADVGMTMQGAVGSAAHLVGYLSGNLEAGTVADAEAKDARNAAFLSLATDLVGMIPATDALMTFIEAKAGDRLVTVHGSVKEGVGYGVGEARSALMDGLEGGSTSSAATAQARADERARWVEGELKYLTAVAVANSRHIPEPARYGSDGELLPWLQPGVDPGEVLTDPTVVRYQLMPWAHEGSGFVTGLTSEVGDSFDDGRDRGLR